MEATRKGGLENALVTLAEARAFFPPSAAATVTSKCVDRLSLYFQKSFD